MLIGIYHVVQGQTQLNTNFPIYSRLYVSLIFILYFDKVVCDIFKFVTLWAVLEMSLKFQPVLAG